MSQKRLKSKKEVWNSIKGYEGYYEISNKGRVRSLDRVTTHGRSLKGKLMTIQIANNGYARVNLSKGCKAKKYTVHLLVAEAFIGYRGECNTQINHIDGNKLNNNVENLEWCTASYNIKHSLKTGLRKVPVGKDSILTKYSEEVIIKIKLMVKEGVRNVDIAKKLDVPIYMVNDVKRGKSWNHIKV